MGLSRSRRRGLRAAVASLSAAAVILALSVVGPAVAQPGEPVSAEREPVMIDPTIDSAMVSLSDHLEPAASASSFDQGYLISDYAFFNRSAMSEAEIQAFLETRSGVCQNTRCLDILRQSSASRAATARCAAYTGGANERISRIIFQVQAACGVSAKVLLVTLQKEQGLITSTTPSERAVNYALGYGCPDTSPCDPTFAGIGVQLYFAAAQFQRYRLNPGAFRHPVGVAFNLATHPRTFTPVAGATPPQCPTIRVTIRNQATAGLYNYTPYTPNTAAISNLYGTGDSCSSYGNRNFWRLYTDWFGSPTTLVPSGVETERLAGSDRWATAAKISKDAYPDGASTVYLAVGSNFADGLAAAPAAAIVGAPLLLVSTRAVPSAIATELRRLAPTRIVIVGGEGVVSSAVVQRVRELLPAASISRYSGADRYGTALAVAENAFSAGSETVYLATGGGFADALAASAAAGSIAAPVLLVRPQATALDAATIDLIKKLGATRVIIAGGRGVVSEAVEASAKRTAGVTEVIRLGGIDRYATAAALNTFAFDSAESAYIASGLDFPDALAAAAAAGAKSAPLHLSNGICTPTTSLQHLVDTGVERVAFVGGAGVLKSTVTEFLTCG